ncbi:Fimbrial protein [bacterium HR12]|nr:Fimbrial protein [bacterium HR12]
MRRNDREAEIGGDDGFSVVELMVVILVVGLLIAIALPTYLGARARAADRALQTDMRTGLAAALAYYAQTRDWTGFDRAQAVSEEPRIPWGEGPAPPDRGEVSIHVHEDQELLLVGLSSSGTYFCLAQVPGSPSTARGRGDTFAEVDTVAECTGGW